MYDLTGTCCNDGIARKPARALEGHKLPRLIESTRLRGFDPERDLALVRVRFDKYMEFHDYIGPPPPKTAVVKTYPVPQA